MDANIVLLEPGWNRVEREGVQKLQLMIQQHNSPDSKQERVHFTTKEYSDLYSTVYNMCIQKVPHNYPSQLYARYEQSILSYLKEVSLPAIKRMKGQYMLQELAKRWENHKIMKRWLVKMFMYIDRFYVKRNNKPSLEEVATSKFREVVFQETVKEATAALLDLIEQDRKGVIVDRSLIHDAVLIYVEMEPDKQTYIREFERPFIEATKVHYQRQADAWLESDSCPEYLLKAEMRIREEKQRVVDYLDERTQPELMQTVHSTLLMQHQTAVINKENSGALAMLKTHAVQDFARMHRLYVAVGEDALQPIAKIVSKHIEQVGMNLIEQVNAKKNVVGFVPDLLAIHDKYYDLVLGPFQGHATFHKALKEAFESVVNKGVSACSTSELLALYCDKLLVKGGIRMSDAKLQDTLDRVVRLFTYLTDKDLFAEFYRKHLSRRLLLQRSASSDAETSMIGRLKLRCGAQFTSKFEGMMNDMKQAEQTNRDFKLFSAENNIDLNGVEFSIKVLTTGFWPTHPTDELTLDDVFNKCVDTFKTFYRGRTSNRRVRWVHTLGMVTLAGHFPRKRVDLSLSTVQASMLLLFNTHEELSIADIIKHTGMSAPDVKKYLRSLVSGKARVLVKKPPSGYSVNDKISVNKAFTHQQRRVRIPLVSNRATAQERKSSQATVSEDRRHAIEANIVRVMKARKQLAHAQLVSEVSQQLMQYFTPDPRQIKKRIEDLIQREYLERDSEVSSVYHYLA